MNRRKSREAAFILIFERIFSNSDIDEMAETAKLCREFEFDDYSIALAKGTVANTEALDEIISPGLNDWKIERISKVSLAILRMCIFEFMFLKEVPMEISINEAIELTKKYSDPKDTSFVNGVLGFVARGGAPRKE